MPELPEVETVVRDLRPMLVGKTIAKISTSGLALRRPWPSKSHQLLVNRTFAQVARRGKWILLDLGDPWLVVHLGMTGQFTVVDRSVPTESHTHAVFTLTPGQSELRFRDVRRFGSISFYPDRPSLEADLDAARLGPEPWDLTVADFRAALAKTSRCLKAILLDQTVLAGVGNIYADESLFEARLHPERRGCELTRTETNRLHQAILAVLTRAIECRGSSIRDYIGGSGLRGEFQNEFAVYGQTGEPCPRCHAPIQHLRLAGRSSHFCGKCQVHRKKTRQRMPRTRHVSS